MKKKTKTERVEAKMFRCKNCQRRLQRELKQMEDHTFTKADEQRLNKLLAKAKKGLVCTDCFKPFKKTDKKYDSDVELLK